MLEENGKRYCDRCGVELTNENNKCGYELCDKCNDWLNAECKVPTTKNDLAVSSELEKNSKKLEKDFGELDCISRAEVIDIVENTVTEWLKGDVNFMYPSLIKKIIGLSPVTPQPRKGHWRPIYQGDEIIDYRCSKCEFGNTFGKSTHGMNYCPHCGAKMVEPQESE